jgi:hypothetical protein
MDTTLNPKQADPPHVLITQADEELAHAYEQITRADEEIARAEEQLSKLEHDAARRGNRRSFGGRAVRGFTGLALTACICVAAYVWQSPSYGVAARQIIARWGPQLVPTSSLTLESLSAQPSPPTVAKTAPPQPAPLAQPEIVAPTTTVSPELMQLLQSMARDIATVAEGIEQLKASQEQVARDNTKGVEQLKANQEQMARAIAKASEQNLRPKISSSPPRPTATPTRKPVPTHSSP